MEQVELTAQSRSKQKTRGNKRLRLTGRVPAIVYGEAKEPEVISVDNHSTELALNGADSFSAIVNLDGVGEGKTPTIIRDIQRHPVTGKLEHIDFLRIDLSAPVAMDLPVILKGTPAGVRGGGILDHTMRVLSVRGLPLALPKEFVIDVSGLGLNESVHVSDLNIPEGVEVMVDAEEAVASVLVPRGVEEETEGEEEMTEPEVIGEKKDDEE